MDSEKAKLLESITLKLADTVQLIARRQELILKQLENIELIDEEVDIPSAPIIEVDLIIKLTEEQRKLVDEIFKHHLNIFAVT